MSNEPVNETTKRLNRAVIAASERSQSNIAESVHGTLCQTLSGASLLLSVLEREFQGRNFPEAVPLDRLREMLDLALDEARHVLTQLQPVAPGEEGLMTALARLAAETSARTPCEFECEDAVLIDDPEVAMAFYRIAEEAVKNAVAHAGAKQIKISLTNPNEVFVLTIADDGCGFVPHPPRKKIGGTELIQARALAVGGKVTTESQSGDGTTVTFTLPKCEVHRSQRSK